MEVPFTQMANTGEGIGLGGNNQGFSFTYVKFEMTLYGYPSGNGK